MYIPLKATYRRVQTLRISLIYCKRVAPEVQISGQNSKFWQFWELYSHIFAPINVKFDTGEPCQILRLSGQRVAPSARKTNFWTIE